MKSLPPTWTVARLKDLGAWMGGGTPSKAVAEYWRGEIPWVSAKDMKVERIADAIDHISRRAVDESSTKVVPGGSVLVVTRSGILEHTLPVAVADREVAINQDLKALVPAIGVDPTYVAWALRANTQRILATCSKAGTTVANVNTAMLLDFEFPLAPLAEQPRIVAAIEEQFSRLDAAMAMLDACNHRLATLRRTLLNKAFDGLPRRPLGEVATVRGGHTPRGLMSTPGGTIPFYKVGDMNSADEWGRMGVARTYLSPETADAYRVRLWPAGTLIFPKQGGAIATNKKRVLTVEAACDLNTMGVTPGKQLEGSFLRLWFETVDLDSLSDGSVVAQIKPSRIASMPTPVPAIESQRRLVKQIELQLSLIDSLRGVVQAAQKRSRVLRRAILERAFRGELVHQDPDDEPASLLLEHIRAEGPATSKPKRQKRVTA